MGYQHTALYEHHRTESAELRTKLLAELAGKRRTTVQLAQAISTERQIVYRTMQTLEREGMVTSIMDRRRAPRGGADRVWSRTEDARPPEVPPRDPLTQALFGSPP